MEMKFAPKCESSARALSPLEPFLYFLTYNLFIKITTSTRHMHSSVECDWKSTPYDLHFVLFHVTIQ